MSRNDLNVSIGVSGTGVTGSPTGIHHVFSKVHFNSPTFCDYCGEFIWGLGRQGYSCRACRYAIHKRCLEFNPPTCTKAPIRRSNVAFVSSEIIQPTIDNACFLIVEVLEAKENPPSKTKFDAYCTLELGIVKHKTGVVEQVTQPLWDEKFAIQFDPTTKSPPLVVCLIERNRWSTDVKFGSVSINLQPFLENDSLVKDQWYKLDVDKERDFEIHLKVWVTRSEGGQVPLILNECQTMLTRFRSSTQSIKAFPIPALPPKAGTETPEASSHSQKPDPECFAFIKRHDVDRFFSWIESATLEQINQLDQWDCTPLTYACSLGSDEAIINRLLEVEGIDVKVKNRDGNTALHYFCQRFESPDCVEPFNAFIKKGADVNAKNINGETPLFKAIFNKAVRLLLVNALIENGADVNILNPHNEGTLHYAVRLGREDLVSALLNAGADITVRGNRELKTPYELALVYKDKKMTAHLRSVHDLFDWLEKNGLMKYKLHFLKKDLYLSKFASFNAQTLDEMGILDDKERASILEAVNKAKGEAAPAQAAPEEESKEHISKIITDLQQMSQNPCQDMNEIGDNWIIKPDEIEFTKKLGSGAAGDVYRGLYKGKNVAIKVLKEMNGDKEKDEFMKEFKVMSALRSNHLVYLFGVAFKPKLCMVMELCSRGSLFDILQDESLVLTWERVLKIISDAVDGVLQLHKCTPEILHRDLKSLNLLLNENWEVKVCDFGLSRFNQQEDSETLQKMRGTMAYCAPETYYGIRYTTKSDVYSLGIIFWELCSRCIKQKYERPFGEYPNLKFDFQIIIQSAKQKLRPTIPPSAPQCIKDLIALCFSPEPEKRPTCQEFADQLKLCTEDYEKNKEGWEAAILPKK